MLSFVPACGNKLDSLDDKDETGPEEPQPASAPLDGGEGSSIEGNLREALSRLDGPPEALYQRGREVFGLYEPNLEVLECIFDSEDDTASLSLHRGNSTKRLVIFEGAHHRVEVELGESVLLAGGRRLSLKGRIEGFSGSALLERLGTQGLASNGLDMTSEGRFALSIAQPSDSGPRAPQDLEVTSSFEGEVLGGHRENWRIVWQDPSGARFATEWFVP